MPAHSEEHTIVDSLRAFLGLQSPDVRVLVIDDGSTDGTLARLMDPFALEHPPPGRGPDFHARIRALWVSRSIDRLLVVEKANGGKANALNLGLALVATDRFCGVDAESLLEALSLLRAGGRSSKMPSRLPSAAACGSQTAAQGVKVGCRKSADPTTGLP